MEKLEKVEKLREKTGVTYEEAKEALDACDWDVLDATVYLEKAGKVKGPQKSTYSTDNYQSNFQENTYKNEYNRNEYYRNEENSDSFGETLGTFFHWCGRVIAKGNRNYFEISRHNEKPVEMPITVMVILTCLCFWVVIPLLFIGIFFNFRYSFSGPDIKKNQANDFRQDDFKDDMRSENNRKNN